jgi:hypothetical protein
MVKKKSSKINDVTIDKYFKQLSISTGLFFDIQNFSLDPKIVKQMLIKPFFTNPDNVELKSLVGYRNYFFILAYDQRDALLFLQQNYKNLPFCSILEQMLKITICRLRAYEVQIQFQLLCFHYIALEEKDEEEKNGKLKIFCQKFIFFLKVVFILQL